jgi:methionine aminopeptidase
VAVEAAVLPVGPGRRFERIGAALEAAAAGDTIAVYPRSGGKSYGKVALHVRKARIRIRAESAPGERIVLDGRGFDYSGRGAVPRAIVQFSKGADGGVIEGFELRNAQNGSHNGAGVRINQANNVTVRHCTIHGNDMGIMSNGDGGPGSAEGQLIEGCLIHSNGDRSHPGYNHNLYLGGTEVTVRGCEVHSSLTGHNIKSRAHRNVIVACYVHDSANRELDLVDGKGDTDRPGSDALLFGNIIVKDPKCGGNRSVIHFGQDGGKEHDGTLRLINNTIVTPFISPVVHLSASKARAELVNNIVWNGGVRQNKQVLVRIAEHPGTDHPVSGAGNWLAEGFGDRIKALRGTIVGSRDAEPPFRDAEGGDYRLEGGDRKFINRGAPLPPNLMQALGGKALEYRHPQTVGERLFVEKPDPGAYEGG